MFIFFLFLLFACSFFSGIVIDFSFVFVQKIRKKNLAIITNHLESNILATFQVEKMAKSIFWFNQWSENKNYQYLTCFYVLVALDYEFSLITGFPWLDIIPVRMPILQNQSSRCCSSHLSATHTVANVYLTWTFKFYIKLCQLFMVFEIDPLKEYTTNMKLQSLIALHVPFPPDAPIATTCPFENNLLEIIVWWTSFSNVTKKQSLHKASPCYGMTNKLWITNNHSDDLAGVGTKLPSWLGNRIILQLRKNKGRFKICFLIISLLYQVYKLSWLFFQFLVTSLQIIYLKSEEKLQVDHFWG